MSSPTRNPSILALNRFFKPSAFNTGPPIPKVLPVSLAPSPSPSNNPSDSRAHSFAIPARRRIPTPELTSSPTSSISSLPSTSSMASHSRSSSRSTGTGPTPLPLESDHIKQIFAQPLLVDLLAGTVEHETEAQAQEHDLAEKMDVHMNLLNSGNRMRYPGPFAGLENIHPSQMHMHMQIDGHGVPVCMYEVDGGYAYAYPEGYYQDSDAYGPGSEYAYALGYAPGAGVEPEAAYDPAYAQYYQHNPAAGAYPTQNYSAPSMEEFEFDVPQTARPEDYFGSGSGFVYLQGHAFGVPSGFAAHTLNPNVNANPNLNPNALPFVPSTTTSSSTTSTDSSTRDSFVSSVSSTFTSASAPTSTSTSSSSSSSTYAQAAKSSNVARKNGLGSGLGLDTLIERAQKRLSADGSTGSGAGAGSE